MRRFVPFVLLLTGAGLLAADPAPRPHPEGRPEGQAQGGRPARGGKPGARRGLPSPRSALEGQKGRGQQDPGKGLQIGNQMLKSNSSAGAVDVYKRQIERDPSAPAPHVGLGRAYARLGRCAEALDELAPQVGTKPFGAEAATSAGVCARKLGLLDEAVWYNQLAVDLSPGNTRALTMLAINLWDTGDDVGVEAVLDELMFVGKARDASLYARSALALAEGDIEEFDVLRALWEREDRSDQEIRRLDAQAWLDVGDPVAADRALAGARRFRPSAYIRVARAETARRLGDPTQALTQLADRKNSVVEGEQADAVRLRVLTDDGRMEEARALRDEYAASELPDLVASRWYYARATQDVEAMAREAGLYRTVNRNPLRTLDQLVPVVTY